MNRDPFRKNYCKSVKKEVLQFQISLYLTPIEHRKSNTSSRIEKRFLIIDLNESTESKARRRITNLKS